MNKWFLSAELFSLILIVILMLNFYERRWKDFPRRKIYHLCLVTSASSILLNMLCVYTIACAWKIPLWVNIVCNSAYFLLIVLVSSIIAYYLMYLLYEHIYQRKGLRAFLGILVFLFVLYLILIIYNVKSGVVFYFDENREYHRGPLVNIGYGIMAIQLLLLILFTYRNKFSIGAPMKRVMSLLPPSIILLTIYQIIYPEVLFNGGILVAANIILFINFQSRRIEQDTLTTGGNRKSFHQELEMRIAGAQQFQVIMVAIHKFGSINYRYGNEKGDELLYGIAKWLERSHPSGAFFRVGNVEFALMVPYKEREAANELLDKIWTRFQQPWMIDEVNVVLDTSFAELICTEQKWNATDIMEFLNFSLSIAGSFKNRVTRFDEETYNKMERRNKLIKHMQYSAKEELFQVWFQPIYHCSTGRYAMAEALVRMVDSEGEHASPSEFVPLAEQHGLITEISRVVLEDTCRLLADPSAAGLESVSVNLSMQQFISSELPRDIGTLIEKYHLDPGRLRLEVTERVLSEDSPQMHQVMDELEKMGVRFALDDFGTGYSNLSTVMDCPFSCIKLDKSLIQRCPDNERSASIVDAMLDLFHHIGFEVVAEGVETKAQAETLTDKGADWIQGFYYARPMPKDAFLYFINTSNK